MTPDRNHDSPLRRLWTDWLRPILVVLVILGTFRSAVADWNDVPTGSMRPTILEGDRIVIHKLAYDVRVPFVGWRVAHLDDPERGDVVVFPSPLDGRRLVKRIVGLPGDVVEIRDHRVFIDGERLELDMATSALLPGVTPADRAGMRVLAEELGDTVHAIQTRRLGVAPTFGPITVPEGQYFMLGDNRDDSLDSRVFGTVRRGAIEGRVVAVALSIDPDARFKPRWPRFFTPMK